VQPGTNEPQSGISLFTVVSAGVNHNRRVFPGKLMHNIEINPVFQQVRLALGFVPFVMHGLIVVTKRKAVNLSLIKTKEK
jgi:succinyl-CoA synthetase alpha subunit